MGFKEFAVMAFLLFLPSLAFSQEIFVTLKPVSQSAPVTIYESEITEFELVVINNEGVGVENFNARIFVGNELSIVVDGDEKKEQKITFLFLPPKLSSKKTVKVKGLGFSNTGLPINVKYGVGENLETFFSTSIRVAKNPLFVNARLKKTGVEPLEENSVLLDLKNASDFEINGFKAELFVPDGFENRSHPLELFNLSQNQSVENSSFAFVAPPEPVGEKFVLLKIQYEDAAGKHLIEKSFAVDVRKRERFLLLLGGFVVLLLAISFYLNSKKKEEHTSVKDSH